ncbi:MAG: hypothetical protein AB7E72_01560 [Lysobacterales bacterium]
MNKFTIPKVVLFCIASLLTSNLSFAQSVPPLMNYQGHLTNATGQSLANGQYTLTFNVYNVPNGGAAVWGPQVITADVIDGYFNVVLSTDSTGGDSITTAFTAQPRYFSIRVDAGAEILPRQQVLSAPYAVQAGHASQSDIAASVVGTGNIFPSMGFDGIGTTNPDRALSVTGAAKVMGNLEVTGGVSSNGALSAGADSEVLGVLSVGKIKVNSQKICRLWTSGSWKSITAVPDSWTRANCDGFRVSEGAVNYNMGCMFTDGTSSMGSGTNLPSPNCG